jgi:hypothetical protein
MVTMDMNWHKNKEIHIIEASLFVKNVFWYAIYPENGGSMFLETCVNFYQTTLRHIPEDILHSQLTSLFVLLN